MKKKFVPYKIALELRDKGFNELCMAIAFSEEIEISTSFRHLNSEIKKLGCSNEMVAVPMYFQVIEWFKEVHKMNVGIFYHSDSPTCCAVVEKFTDKGLELFGNEEAGTLLEFVCVPRIQEKSQLKKAILEALKLITYEVK